MADKKLSSVSAVTDAAYIYAETSSGGTVKISKADLASVVAGLIGMSQTIKDVGHLGLTSIDDRRNCVGYYNSNTETDFSGTFISFGSTSPIQFRFRYDGNLNQYRVFNPTNSTWSSWKSV